MMWVHIVLVGLSVLTIVFNLGGTVWLAKNHMKHAQESIDRLEARATQAERDIALIKGALGIGTR